MVQRGFAREGRAGDDADGALAELFFGDLGHQEARFLLDALGADGDGNALGHLDGGKKGIQPIQGPGFHGNAKYGQHRMGGHDTG